MIDEPVYTVLADIRAALGVGEKPMLTELPQIIKAIITERDELRTLLRATLDNHDKMTAADCADIARGVLQPKPEAV